MPPRLILASPMKVGATYAASVIRRYTGIAQPDIAYDWLAEQNVTPEFVASVRQRSFCLGLHMRPHSSNLLRCQAEAISIAVLWRNLGDVVVSFDDHAFRYHTHNPIFYVDHDVFVSLPAQRRYRCIIENLVPWNIGFYLHWRRAGYKQLYRYEAMLDDRSGYFRALLAEVGIGAEEERLRAALSDEVAPDVDIRFNVGMAGRSADMLDAANRDRIEDLIRGHPQAAALEPLLAELPWRTEARLSLPTGLC